eukprot:scaffold71002_cov45-Phaeocystis_antarctica.AAC.1
MPFFWRITCHEDVMSPNGTHLKAETQTATIRSPNGTHLKAETQTATIRSQWQRHAARLKCALNVRLAQKPPLLRMSAAIEPGSMPLPLRPDCGCLSFSLQSIDDGASSLCSIS